MEVAKKISVISGVIVYGIFSATGQKTTDAGELAIPKIETYEGSFEIPRMIIPSNSIMFPNDLKSPLFNDFDTGSIKPAEYLSNQSYGSNRFPLHIDTRDIIGSAPILPKTTFGYGPVVSTPYGIHYGAPNIGANIAGLNTNIRFSEKWSVDVNGFYSNSYFGAMQPHRINNGIVSVSVTYELNDRIFLIGFGQYSGDKNMHPAHQMGMGLGNQYGGAVVIMITDKFGIMGGYKREYVNGKWQNNYYAAPYIRR